MKSKILFGLIGAIILAIIGLLIGINIGSNYDTGFELMGISLYEATGYLGALIGFVVFVLLVIFSENKRAGKKHVI